MKEKKYFLFILCILILLAFSFGTSYSEEQSGSFGAVPGSGGLSTTGTGNTPISTSTTDTNWHNYNVRQGLNAASGYVSAVAGSNKTPSKYQRNYDWVYNNEKDAPADKSASGKTDDDNYSSKGVISSATILKNTVKIGQEHNAQGYTVHKTYLSFDTSGIPADAVITSLNVVFYAKSVQSTKQFYIQAYKSVYEDPLWNSDWGAVVGPELEKSDSRPIVTDPSKFKSESNLALALANPDSCKNVISIDLNKDVNLIKKGGITRIALVSSRTTEMVTPDDDSMEYVEIYSPNADKKLRPSLDFRYEGDKLQTKPVLSWLAGDPTFKGSGASTETLNDGENVVIFKVRYISSDGGLGTPPADDGHQVWIDLDGDGKFDSAGEKINMEAVDATDLDYSDGKDYRKQVTINSRSNNIKYQFYFITASGKIAGGTPSSIRWFTAIQAAPKKSGSSNNLCFISSLKR